MTKRDDPLTDLMKKVRSSVAVHKAGAGQEMWILRPGYLIGLLERAYPYLQEVRNATQADSDGTPTEVDGAVPPG